ncbi:DUF1295 domain-containing protein [Parerythrobacter aurantius]|uniref:DUF1295 domain-containing protein n=1 Tax=Parerythrobacter aurantius TaxID=3127706 RepID=UPI0032516F10
MIEALLTNAAVLLAATLVMWAIAVKIHDASIVDSYWGGGMALMAAVSWFQLSEPGLAANALAAMAIVWGVRLALHILTRWLKEGEDQRYKRIMKKARENNTFAFTALTKVFLGQAVLLFAVCSPAQVGILASEAPAPLGALAYFGIALWAFGMFFETVGDLQLRAFKNDPANEGKILDTGLWRYTRHPNYFGDACAWWGIWLVTASIGWDLALYTLIGPVFLTFTLTKWSGAALTEHGMKKKRGDAYADYIARTSAFVPWPPKSSPGPKSS